MTPEQNLDEDILQCRAEIQRALGQNPAEEEESSALDSRPTDPSEELLPKDQTEADTTDFLIRDPDPEEEEEEEELIGDLIAEQTNSNSGSFAASSSIKEDLAEKNTAPVNNAQESAGSFAKSETLFFPRDLEYYNKILKTLKDQKENLTQTCREQEKHILNLTSQAEHLRLQYQQADERAADLEAQLQRLSQDRQTSAKLQEQLEQALSETEKLRQELAAVQRWHQETIKEKNQQIEQNKSQREQLRSLEADRQTLQNELDSLKKKNDALIKTIASLNLENEHLRQEKTSHQQQVFSLQEALSRQQMESQKTVSVLREELAAKADLLQQRQSQLDRLGEELRAAQEQQQKAEKSAGRPSETTPASEVYFPTQADLQEELSPTWLPQEPAVPIVPRFDLSDQMLSPLRRQNSIRRQPPSAGRSSPAETIRTVVKQFVAAHPRTQDVKPPAYQPSAKAPASKIEYPPAPPKQIEEQPMLIAQIVQRDIESYCKQNKWIFIEFPSG